MEEQAPLGPRHRHKFPRRSPLVDEDIDTWSKAAVTTDSGRASVAIVGSLIVSLMRLAGSQFLYVVDASLSLKDLQTWCW